MNIAGPILIFGGTGSLGKTLIKRFAREGKVVFAYSRDEAKHWTLKNELAGTPEGELAHFVVGDIRDKSRVAWALRRVQPRVVIIAAALKQVDTCELSPNESVLTNLIGTQNVVEAVTEYNLTAPTVSAVLFVSTDKACAPVNVYGMCKAISERIVTSVRDASHDVLRTKFLGVRYGNVLESRGSIIPLFKHQALHGDALTVTHPDMTRFVMTLNDSVDLIQTTLTLGHSGEIWIPRLKAMRIGDLANIFGRRYGKPVKVVGLRPGEKMHEALINESESVRTAQKGQHYVIYPATTAPFAQSFQYTSADDVMTEKELEAHLTSLDIFERPISSFEGKSIEEIVTKAGIQKR